MSIRMINLFILLFLSFSIEVLAVQKTDQQLNSALKELELQIDILTHKNPDLKLKFSRLFETNLEKEHNDTIMADISIVPSISIPYKDNFYYTMMIRNKYDYYTLRGDLIYSDIENSTLLVTARNQYTYFVKILQNKTLLFKRLSFVKKQPQLDLEIVLNLQQFPEMNVNRVFVVNPLSRGNFLAVDQKKGSILCFDKHGEIFNHIQTSEEILQIEKVSNYLVVLTKNEFFYLNINRNYTKNNCVYPESSLQSFVFQEASYKSVYAIKNNTLLQYDLGSYCRPIKTYLLPENASTFLTSQLIFIESKGYYYTINYTEGILRPFNLPVKECLGTMKINLNKKLMSQYIISRLCLQENGINVAHILVNFDSENSEIADFSKFRIPLILFSFGVIIFVTVKNKKKQNEENVNSIEEVLIGSKTQYRLEQKSDGKAKNQKDLQCTINRSNISISSLKYKSN